MLYHKGSFCEPLQIVTTNIKETKYHILKLNEFTSETVITYVGYNTEINLLDGFMYINNYVKSKHYFSLVNWIIDKFRNYIDNGLYDNFSLINQLDWFIGGGLIGEDVVSALEDEDKIQKALAKNEQY